MTTATITLRCDEQRRDELCREELRCDNLQSKVHCRLDQQRPVHCDEAWIW